MRTTGIDFDRGRWRPLSRRTGGLVFFVLRSAGRRHTLAACLAAVAALGFVPASGAARPPSPGDGSPRATVHGGPEPHVAPLSAALRRYLEERAAPRARPALGQRARGLVPSPIDFSYLSGAPVQVGAGAALPTAYDLRTFGRLGPVDDQGSYGTCWAFAALDSLESSLMPADPQDFSEDNLVLTAGFDGDPYQTGGSALEATGYLARWGGPVTSAEDPYGDAATPRGAIAVKHVQDVVFLPPRSGPLDNIAIKQAVMTYGAVYTAMYFGSPDPAYFNDSTDAYYYWGEASFDHAVTIVGWDDGFSRGKFVTEPPGDGAFVVRNSWGVSFGQGGYFYVSYYDACVGSRLGPPGTARAYGDVNAVFAAEPAGNFRDVYDYDLLGWTDSVGFGSDTAWCAAAYTARSDDSLVAVGFYTPVPGTTYEVYAGIGPTTPLDLAGSGSEAFAGYHTIVLGDPVQLTADREFRIAVKLVTPGFSYPIALETNIEGYSGAASAAPGQSYVSPDGATWTDVTALPDQQATSVCLKAFTRPAGPVDLTAPVTTVSGASSAWRHLPLRLAFAASDEKDGSGVGSTQYKIGSGDWQTGAQAVVAAPKTHVSDGVHVVLYRSLDKAGNVETVKKCVARIDTRRPTAQAPRSCSVRRGAYATLRFRLLDAQPSRGACRAIIKVRTLSGRLRLAFTPRYWYASGTLGSYRFLCPRSLARGTYRFWVTAHDGAGNTSAKAAANYLTVR